ncbi:MAG: PilZ domain-containing protein [Bdellovibrionales bacterium]|nr:PilZ domain-containing protein [Bdellovibrionales bacterium]
MYQIGLVGKPSPQRFKLKQILEANGHFHPVIFSYPGQLLSGVEGFQLSAIVLILESLNQVQLKHLNYVDKHFHRIPVVFVAPEVQPQVRMELTQKRYRSLSVVDFRKEIHDLNSIILKMTEGEPVFHRAHVRYQTHQLGEIVNPRGKISRVRLLNLSTGGAQIEFRGDGGKEGDEIFLRVQSLRRSSYAIRARIKWYDPRSKHAGIEFCLPASPKAHLALV